MSRSRRISRDQQPVAQSRKALGLLESAIAVTLVGYVDYATGWDVSVTALYLAPVAVAVWRVGLWAGVLMCGVTLLIRLAINLTSPMPAAADIWNAGMDAGEMLAFAFALHYHRLSRQDTPILASFAAFAALVCCLGALVLAVHQFGPKTESPVGRSQASGTLFGADRPHPEAAGADGELAQVQRRYETCVRTSRAVLLGSRTLGGGTCHPPVKPGQLGDSLPVQRCDYDGGVGNCLEFLVAIERLDCQRPMQEFNYAQQRLRRHLQNQLALNEVPLAASDGFARSARSLAGQFADAAQWPSGFQPLGTAGGDDWPGNCWRQLNEAVAQKDLPGAKRWSAELATAAFVLHDLHRWLAFLYENYLTALDFQKQCESVFAIAEQELPEYSALRSPAYLPTGMFILRSDVNFLEIERHAEQMFGASAERTAALASDEYRTADSVWIAPRYRAAYLNLERALSPANRQVLRQAVRTPYENTFLTSALHRALESDTLTPLSEAVRRFDALHPRASVSQLMDVLVSSGHSYAGLEWGDRYQPALMQEGASLRGSGLEACGQAARWTNDFYRRCEYGTTLTLRHALDLRRLDCVRSTDMIAAIYRDSGRAGIGHVVSSLGTFGHSVSAWIGDVDGRAQVVLEDGLDVADQRMLWPDAYVRGHRWPAGMENNGTPYCAELYVRGLETQVWAGGYILRGPGAGTLTTARVPYLPKRDETTVQRVFDGPYPQ